MLGFEPFRISLQARILDRSPATVYLGHLALLGQEEADWPGEVVFTAQNQVSMIRTEEQAPTVMDEEQ